MGELVRKRENAKNEETRIAISAQANKTTTKLRSRVKIRMAVLRENRNGIDGKEETGKGGGANLCQKHNHVHKPKP